MFFRKHSLTLRKLDLSCWAELVDDNGVVMQITMNYSVIIHANFASCHRCSSFSPGGSSLSITSKEAGSSSDWAGEAVGECRAQRDGGRRFAGLSGLEKQGSRDGASAEQGSSFKARKRKTELLRLIVPLEGDLPQTHFSDRL